MTCVCGLQRKVHLRVNAFFLWARSPSPRPHAALPGSGVSNSALLPRLAPCEQTDGASSPPSVSLGTPTQRQPTGLQGWGVSPSRPRPRPAAPPPHGDHSPGSRGPPRPPPAPPAAAPASPAWGGQSRPGAEELSSLVARPTFRPACPARPWSRAPTPRRRVQ